MKGGQEVKLNLDRQLQKSHKGVMRSSRLCVLFPALANPKRNLSWPRAEQDSPKQFGRVISTQRREERGEKNLFASDLPQQSAEEPER
jgi:hypothetical protein